MIFYNDIIKNIRIKFVNKIFLEKSCLIKICDQSTEMFEL